MAKGLLAFQIEDQLLGITERVRRAIGQCDVGVPAIRRLIAACERLKLKPTSPIYKTDCWAHVGIGKLKTVIYTKEHLEYNKVVVEREAWKRHGWTLMAIARRQINAMSDEQLTGQLRQTLVVLGKMK